jgi:hypothetical protein
MYIIYKWFCPDLYGVGAGDGVPIGMVGVSVTVIGIKSGVGVHII